MSQEFPALPAHLSLFGRRVVVTGAASGIGRATAKVLALLGADLVLSDVSRLAGTRNELDQSVSVETLECDLLTPGAVEKLFSFGAVDALCHCAGIVPALPWNEDPDWEARFNLTMSVNVRLPIELGHAAIEHMSKTGGGRVVLIGSLAALTGGTLLATPPDYAASKGAVHSLVRLLARKGAPRGVIVNAIAPGPVATPFSANLDFPRENFPLGRMAEPQEIAWPIAFLCTAAASNFLGEIVNVNGGVYLG